ncbi:uncharacterized protein [Rutidosis leptorrhynchoides]|uniref:uncharacterized protein n=1 Tax=Rutidosis leptorrhynchoides TaxID=125765 RepID=UPI003A9A1120
MAQNKTPSTSAVETKTYVFLSELELGKQSQVQPNADASTFTRHPFNCIQIEDLQPTLGKFVVDPLWESARAILEFDLGNERGNTIRTTLWGDLGDSFLKRQPAAPAYYYIILTSVSVKKGFNGILSLSSTSTTLIIDNAEVPTLIDFKERMSGIELPIAVEPFAPGWQLPPPKDGTLRELLDMARKVKKKFVCKARKGFDRRFGQHWCESCNDNVPEPITRFRVICDVRDDIATMVMVLFDETAEAVTQTTAKALLAEVNAETCNTVLPNALTNLVGTTRVVLLKATSYYDQGTYESFNCIKVYAPDSDPTNHPLPPTSKPTIPTKSSPSTVTLAPASSTPKGFVVTSDSDDESAIGEEDQNVNESVSPKN